jgi:hypothetical protein
VDNLSAGCPGRARRGSWIICRLDALGELVMDNLPAGCWESCWLLGELIVDNLLAGCSGRAGCIIDNRGDG